MKEAQTKLILKHLESGASITPMDALNLYGCFRLGARIYDLKQAGHNIETTKVTKNGKTFASYSLVQSEVA